MKIKFSLILICLAAFSCSAFAQAEEARKVEEISHFTPCGEFLARMDSLYSEYSKSSGYKIYVVYYEGKHPVYGEYNEKLRWVNPRRGDVVSRAREVPLFLKSGYRSYRIAEENIVLLNGGYREKFSLEFWIVPKGGEVPKATPTLTAKDIKFRKGKPYKVRDFTGCY